MKALWIAMFFFATIAQANDPCSTEKLASLPNNAVIDRLKNLTRYRHEVALSDVKTYLTDLHSTASQAFTDASLLYVCRHKVLISGDRALADKISNTVHETTTLLRDAHKSLSDPYFMPYWEKMTKATSPIPAIKMWDDTLTATFSSLMYDLRPYLDQSGSQPIGSPDPGYAQFASTYGKEQECVEKRLDQDGGCYQDIPVMSQSSSPICFAYAAASLFDGYRCRKGEKPLPFRSSPLAIACDETAETDNSFMDGGSLTGALTSISRQGVCPYTTLQKESELTLNFDLLRIEIEDLIRERTQALGVAFIYTNLIHGFDEKDVQELSGRLSSLLQCFGVETVNFPAQNALDALLVASSTIDEFLVGLVKAICKNNRKPVPLQTVQYLSIDDALPFDLEAQTQKLLAQGVDVGITYCSRFLDWGPNHRGHVFSAETGERTRSETACGDHVSVVIGSRKGKNGKCEYLIRNSWGASCDYYYDPKKCEKGNIWVTSNSLFSNIDELVWIP